MASTATLLVPEINGEGPGDTVQLKMPNSFTLNLAWRDAKVIKGSAVIAPNKTAPHQTISGAPQRVVVVIGSRDACSPKVDPVGHSCAKRIERLPYTLSPLDMLRGSASIPVQIPTHITGDAFVRVEGLRDLVSSNNKRFADGLEYKHGAFSAAISPALRGLLDPSP